MILVDLNQVAISNLMVSLNSYGKGTEVNEDLVRHMVLNSLRSYRVKFNEEYGELVICCDNRKYWRKEIFPFYKASRKKYRENSDYDWTLIFETINKIRDELKEVFPYKVIDVLGAEADDIISVLTNNYATGWLSEEKILIISGDKDFMQLQKYKSVSQYAPVLKKFLRTKNPDRFLKEHILRGDPGDGIPNFLSPDNSFVLGKRQKPIQKKKLDTWLDQDPKDFCNDEMLRGYQRNKQLVDLDHVPSHIWDQVMDQYEKTPTGSRSNILNYMIQKRLKNLLDCIQDF